jgi:uncharacterized protein YcbK (DUF882 family)
MKAQFLKIAGVKSEREFYQRFPTEESFFKAFPEALKSAQMGTNVPGIVDGIGMGMAGIESTGNMFEELTPINNPFSTQSIVNNMANKLPVNTSSIPSIGNDVSGLDKVGSQLPGLAGSVIKGISQIKAQKQKLKKAKQTNQLSEMYKTLSGIREQQPERRYVRPEDSLINSDQLYPSTGVGTNVLAKNGKNIDSYQFGGELSSIFSKGGLENIANSGIVDKGMSALFPDMDDSGGATIGGAIGEAAGNFIPIPVVGPMIGKTVGKIAGTLLDTTGKKIKKYNKDTENNLTTMMVNNGATGMHQTNYSYMEDGGLIPLMEEGGELQTHWGGHAETVSQNPYLEDGGETIMFRGNSHNEADNDGNTGIGITYGNSPVEVERGEPATKINDELVVYGNLQIPNQYVELFGDDKAKGKKFKNYIKEISKDEEKQNKLLEKSMMQLDELNPADPFDKLKFNSLKSNVLGANTKLKDIAEKKKIAANLQEAINTTAEEYGVEADALAKGKLKPISNSNMNIAKDGITKKKNNSNEGNVHQNLNQLTQILANKGIDFNITSGYRKGEKTAQGRNSRHATGEALDITFPKLGKEAYNKMINDPDIAKFVYDNGLTVIDEYDPNNLSQTKGSGGHLHFGFDKRTKLSDKFRKEYISKYPSTTTTETTNPEYLIKGNQKGAIDYNDRKTTSNDIWKGDNYKNVWIPKVNSAISNPEIADKLILQIENYSGQDADDVKYQLSKAKTKEEKLKIINNLATDELLGPFHRLVNDSIDMASSPNNNEFAKGIELPETVITKKKTSGIPKETPKKDSKLLNVLSSAMPYIRPSDAEPLDYNQLLGEMYALGNNQLEPVQAQSYQPQLRNPYDISLQDILNENQADYRSQQRMIGNNPAAQAMLNAQKYAANQKVLGEQFRLNQTNKDQVYSQNINTLNDAKLKNLAIYDQQYDRQASAKANTKAITQAALNSISSKYLQNDAANKKLQIYENLYGYRFDDQGRAVNYNGPVKFNSPQITDGQDIPIYDNNGNIVGYKRMGNQQTTNSVRTLPINPEKTTDTKSKKSLNGSIVKAIKNL